MCNGDTVKYKKHNAVTFKNQGIVKALTYYQKSCLTVTRTSGSLRHISGHVEQEFPRRIQCIRQEKTLTKAIQIVMQKVL